MKLKHLLPVVLMVLFAATRWPGLMPPNFSAVYALMFCAGVYFPKRLAWWLPFVTMLVTDMLLNHFYYHVPLVGWYMVSLYLCYAALVLLGRAFGPRAKFLSLLAGGLLGAILFYLVTNTFSWMFNPEYAKTLAGWITALTRGTSGYAPTWEFFRNTLGSSGLFTGLFAGAMKLVDAMEPAEEKEKEAEEKEEESEQPEEQPEKA